MDSGKSKKENDPLPFYGPQIETKQSNSPFPLLHPIRITEHGGELDFKKQMQPTTPNHGKVQTRKRNTREDLFPFLGGPKTKTPQEEKGKKEPNPKTKQQTLMTSKRREAKINKTKNEKNNARTNGGK